MAQVGRAWLGIVFGQVMDTQMLGLPAGQGCFPLDQKFSVHTPLLLLKVTNSSAVGPRLEELIE